MGSSCCGKCQTYKENKKQVKNEYEGICKEFKIKRSYDTSSCERFKPIDPPLEIERVRHEGDIFG